MPRPWMPLYVADYLADTGHLSTIEHGAYLLLIMHYWQNGGLPKEDAKLARITRTSTREWAGMRNTLAEFFGESWSHARIDRELSSADAAYQRRAKAGSKGGKAGAMLRQCGSENGAGLKQSQSHLQNREEPSRKQGVQDKAGVGATSAGDPNGDDAFGPPPSPDPAAWTDDAPLGRDAAAGGAR